MKHIYQCFLTTLIKSKYLEVFFEEIWRIQIQFYPKIWCIYFEKRSQCTYIRVSGPTELKSSSPLKHFLSFCAKWICVVFLPGHSVQTRSRLKFLKWRDLRVLSFKGCSNLALGMLGNETTGFRGKKASK